MNPDNKEQKRKLTPAEERRLTQFEETGRKLEERGYRRKDLTVGLVKANLFVILLSIPVMIITMALFFLKNRDMGDLSFSGTSFLVFFVLFAGLIVVHELIHGLTWAIHAEGRFSSIEFGFIKEYFTPYCVCKSPLGKGQYILGAVMPLLILGILPTAAGILFGNGLLFWIGIVMTLSAGGDILIVLQILLYKSPAPEKLFVDHPTQAGVVVYER